MPRNSRKVSEAEITGADNAAFNGSEASGPSRATIPESISGSSAGSNKEASTLELKPVPKPRSHRAFDDGSGTIGSNKSSATTNC